MDTPTTKLGSGPIPPLNKPQASLKFSVPHSPRADDKTRANPMYVAEYMKDIVQHFGDVETTHRPKPGYMATQADITERMRCILVDWLVDVHIKFKLKAEVLYLAVNLVDRFLSVRSVVRQELQLVGVVAMLLASKYEEIYPPEIKEFVYIAANTYTRAQVLRMELKMLDVLEFQLTVPTAYVFLRRGLQVSEAPPNVSHLAHYFSELALLEYKCLSHLPSLQAAASVYLANAVVNPASDPWNKTLEHYMKYSKVEVQACARDMVGALRNLGAKFQASKKKYTSLRYNQVASMVNVDRLAEFC